MAKWQRRLAQVEQEKKRIKKKMEEAPVIPTPPLVIPDIMCERIKEFAMGCFEEGRRPGRIYVSLNRNNCEIHFSEFECNPNISFDFLAKFAARFHTKNINIPSVIKDYKGCESCGHGATWSFTLEINDITL